MAPTPVGDFTAAAAEVAGHADLGYRDGASLSQALASWSEPSNSGRPGTTGPGKHRAITPARLASSRRRCDSGHPAAHPDSLVPARLDHMAFLSTERRTTVLWRPGAASASRWATPYSTGSAAGTPA